MLDIFLVIGIFVVFFGISNAFKERGFSYTDSRVGVAVYFFFGSIILYMLFHQYFSYLPFGASFFPALLSLGGLFFSMPFLFKIIRRYCNPPIYLIERYGHTSAEFLQMNFSYVIPKVTEIAFQQMTITILILIMSVYFGLGLAATSLCLAASFGLIHLSLLFFMDRRIVVLYTSGALVSTAIFPYLVLRVPYGYVYNYIIHWSFYLVAGAAVWAWYTVKKRRGDC